MRLIHTEESEERSSDRGAGGSMNSDFVFKPKWVPFPDFRNAIIMFALLRCATTVVQELLLM